MAGSITPNLGGRPTKLDDTIVVKLESILKVGGTIEEACSYALLNKTTYYRWLKEDEGFATKMEAAKYYADIVAKNVVVNSIVKDKDVDSAKWWLEKRQFRNNSMINITGEKVLVMPSSMLDKYQIEHGVSPDTGNSSQEQS